MSSDLRDAYDYLLGRADPWAGGPLWEWADNGGVVLWNDGATIAFREEVIRVLSRLAPNGLPSFGAVLVLLSATRESWPEGSFRLFRAVGGVLGPEGHPGRALVDLVLKGLHRVRS